MPKLLLQNLFVCQASTENNTGLILCWIWLGASVVSTRREICEVKPSTRNHEFHCETARVGRFSVSLSFLYYFKTFLWFCLCFFSQVWTRLKASLIGSSVHLKPNAVAHSLSNILITMLLFCFLNFNRRTTFEITLENKIYKLRKLTWLDSLLWRKIIAKKNYFTGSDYSKTLLCQYYSTFLCPTAVMVLTL